VNTACGNHATPGSATHSIIVKSGLIAADYRINLFFDRMKLLDSCPGPIAACREYPHAPVIDLFNDYARVKIQLLPDYYQGDDCAQTRTARFARTRRSHGTRAGASTRIR
jgi:hypothetical protein